MMELALVRLDQHGSEGARISGCVGAVLMQEPGRGGNDAARHKLTHQVVHNRERRAYVGWNVSLLFLQLPVPYSELVPAWPTKTSSQ